MNRPLTANDVAACCIEGCGRKVKARGWCELHYRRAQRRQRCTSN